jgi:dipeptidyl aminopeptidase/acylaminoacyl peptidase
MQFGAFAHGDFFFAGAIQGTGEPRAALVKSTGQFNRFLELPGDIHARSESSKPVGDDLSLPRKADKYEDTLEFALGFSMVIPDGPNLLLVRPGQQSPVFSVSPGGAVQPVPVQVPEGFQLFDLKVARNEWIATYTRPSKDPHIKGLESALYAINKTTGKLLAQYTFPPTLGVALTCSDGNTFTVLTREDDKLQLVSLSRVQ